MVPLALRLGKPYCRSSILLGYNPRFDSTHIETADIMEAERINAISALLNDLTGREAELRRYL
jgi:hypothetical protein